MTPSPTPTPTPSATPPPPTSPTSPLTRRPSPSPAGWGGTATRGPLGDSDAEDGEELEDADEERRRRVLASIMGGGEEAAAVLEKLRSTAEDEQVEEEVLRSWCREQQEVHCIYRGGGVASGGVASGGVGGGGGGQLPLVVREGMLRMAGSLVGADQSPCASSLPRVGPSSPARFYLAPSPIAGGTQDVGRQGRRRGGPRRAPAAAAATMGGEGARARSGRRERL